MAEQPDHLKNRKPIFKIQVVVDEELTLEYKDGYYLLRLNYVSTKGKPYELVKTYAKPQYAFDKCISLGYNLTVIGDTLDKLELIRKGEKV